MTAPSSPASSPPSAFLSCTPAPGPLSTSRPTSASPSCARDHVGQTRNEPCETASADTEQMARADRLRSLEVVIGKYLAVVPHSAPATGATRRANGSVSRSRTSTNASRTTNNGTGSRGKATTSEPDSTEQDFADGVMAIRAVAQEKLYLYADPPFATLETFFLARYCLSRAQVYRHLTCAYVVADLLDAPSELNVHPLPRKQRVAKAVKDLAPNPRARQRLWASTLAHFPCGHEITSSDVCRVAASLGAALTSDEPLVLPGIHSSRPSASKPTGNVEDRGHQCSLSPLLHPTHTAYAPMQHEGAVPVAPCPSAPTPATNQVLLVMDHVITPTSPTFFKRNSPPPVHVLSNPCRGQLQLKRTPRPHLDDERHASRHHPYTPVARSSSSLGLTSPPVSPTSMEPYKAVAHRRDSTCSGSPRFAHGNHFDGAVPAEHFTRPPLEASFLSSPVMSPTVTAPPVFRSAGMYYGAPFCSGVPSSSCTPSTAFQHQQSLLTHRQNHECVGLGSHQWHMSPLPRMDMRPHPSSDVLRLPPLVSPLVQRSLSRRSSPMVTHAAVGQGMSQGFTGGWYSPQISGYPTGAMDWNCALPPMGELLYLADCVAQAADAVDGPVDIDRGKFNE